MKWIGSKTHALELLETIAKQISEKNLIELYCGSSVISINLAQKLKRDLVRLASLLVSEKLFPALVSEGVLSKEWNTKEEDEAWKDL